VRVLVTGAAGLLGPYLVDAFADVGDVVTTTRTSGSLSCDLTYPDQVGHLLQTVGPALVVHAAALTQVDDCEHDPGRADACNRGMVQNLVDHLHPEAKLLMFSTDQVYPDVPGPHSEADVGPVNVYGQTKLAGERAAMTRGSSLVLRVNFFGPSRTSGRASLSDFVVEHLVTGAPVTFFSDVLFSPLHLATLASVAVDAVERGVSGVYNVGSRGGMSKLEFGLAVAAHLGLGTEVATAGLSTDRPGRAPRPRDLRMAVDSIEAVLQSSMPTTSDEVAKL
jgi:dTDP-4-dehydrorhamnose reductase